jgi:hypothetical protein
VQHDYFSPPADRKANTSESNSAGGVLCSKDGADRGQGRPRKEATMDFSRLTGLQVEKVWINDEKTKLKLKTSRCWYVLATEEDCCSESWIEHVDGLRGLFDNPINGTEEVRIGEVIATRQDFDQLYSFTILLDGYPNKFQIEFRNSSNGYYGGWMGLSDSDDNLDGFRELNDDF